MPIDPQRESWKPGMAWEQAIADIEYIRGLGAEMGGADRVARNGDVASGTYTRGADDAAIERSIAEINEAIRRSSQKKG